MVPSETNQDVQEIKKYDPSLRQRNVLGFYKIGVSVIAVSWSLFQFYTGAFGSLDAMIQRAVHLGFTLSLAFMLYPSRRKSDETNIPFFDLILSALGVYVTYYIVANFWTFIMRQGIVTTTDFIHGIIAIGLILEAARRVAGLPLTIVGAVCLLYNYMGSYVPGYFGHRGFSLYRIIGHMYLSTEGIFGITLGVSSAYIFLFVLFGAFLFRTGLGKLFIDLAMGLTGHQAGGPAKVSILSSGIFGTINGSTVANVVGTGTFTIPLMKSIGYKPYFAGAVEAASSTGGQLMPPIMGAAAFVMAEFTGIPYLKVAAAAIIPSVLYYASLMIQVHLEAKKLGLEGLPREQLPDVRRLLKKKGHLFLPVGVIVYFLVRGYTPTYSAVAGIVSAVLISSITKETRLKFKDYLAALETGARDALPIAVACSLIGFVIGTATLTGMGMKIASGIVALASGKLLLTLFYTMIASLVLGMGLPTTANYIVTSTMAAPALIALKVPILAAHMFVFYFGIIADLTPPVALGAMAGAGVAGTSFFKTAINSSRLAIIAFIIPYFFVYNPVLLLIDATVLHIIYVMITAIIGVVLLGAGLEGYLLTYVTKWERPVFIVAGLLLIAPGIVTDIIGLCAFVYVPLSQIYRVKKNKDAAGHVYQKIGQSINK